MDYTKTNDSFLNEKLTIRIKKLPPCIVLFWISICIGLFVNFMGVLPHQMSVLGCYASIIIGYGGIVLYMMDSKAYKNKGLIIWLLLVVYMFVMGFIMNAAGVGSYSKSNLLTQDSRYCMYVAIGFAMADKRYRDIYIKMMQNIGFIAIFFGFYGLLVYEYNIYGVIDGERLGIWGISYYCWWMIGTVNIFLFTYAMAGGGKKRIAYICFILDIALGLLFIKRQPVLEAVLIFVMARLMTRQKNKTLKTIGLAAVALIAVAWLASTVPYVRALIDSLMNRFEQDYSTSSRVDEIDYFKQISTPITYLFGYGIGNEFIFDGVHKNAIHIGFYDALYKGGVLYLLYYAYLLKSAICMAIRHMCKKITLSPLEIASVVITILAIISLTYGMCFSYTTSILNFATPFGIVLLNPYGKLRYKE